jgi:hypothetical protein
MIIETPTRSGVPIEKVIEVGGGVMAPLPGTRYHTLAEVMEIDEEQKRVRVKTPSFEAWYSKDSIRDAVSPGDYAVQNAYTNQDLKDD